MDPVIRTPQFSIVYADPPWLFRSWSESFGRRLAHGATSRNRRPPYPCMPVSELCALEVEKICADDCVLFLWATYPMLQEAFAVINAWGFRYKTVAFSWVKLNPSGQGFHFGLGYWTRSNPEICLLATRGRPTRQSSRVRNLIVAPRRDHSRKPDEVRERIIELCGDVPRVELFARETVLGWTAWGNEVSSELNITAVDCTADCPVDRVDQRYSP